MTMRLVARRRWVRVVSGIAAVLGVAGVAAWHWQSVLIGRAAEWYLSRIAQAENTSGKLARRRQVVATLNRQLLMPPPADGQVAELFDLVTIVSNRMATGEISLPWVVYLYTSYQRDMVVQRPTGTPRRTFDEVRAELDRLVRFYAIRKRPEQRGIAVGDLLGTGDDVITLDEIERSERTGAAIDLRTRGAR